MRRRLLGLAGAAAIAALARPLAAPAQDFEYTGSLQFASGDYIFSERTRSLFLFSGLDFSAGRVRVSGSVPLIYQSTPWVSYTGGATIPSGGARHSDVSGRMGGRGGHREVALVDTSTFDHLGLGDPLVQASVVLLEGRGPWPSVRVSGDVKLPLADVDHGFGTGEWDYAVGLSLSKAVSRVLVFADLSYWVLGDLPDLELQDPVGYSLGLGLPLAGGRFGLLASLVGYTRMLPDVDPPLQLAVGLSHLARLGRSLMVSAAVGLTESSPDFTVSCAWRLPL